MYVCKRAATVQEVDKTNRKQFITELSKYLASMPAEEQDAIINRYELRFDEAGPAGEQALLDSLGTPMKVAIALFREHNSEIYDNKYNAPETADNSPAADVPVEADAPQQAAPVEEIPAPQQVAPAEEVPAPQQVAPAEFPSFVPVAPPAPAEEDMPAPEVEDAQAEDDGFDLGVDDMPDESDDLPSPAAKGAAITGSVLLCALTILVGLALMSLPVGALYLGIRTLISGFASFAYLPDTLLLLGIGAVSTAVGLAVAWLVIWMVVTVVKALRRRILIRTGRLSVPEGGHEI